MSDDYVRDTFGPAGILSQHFEGYEVRTGQLELAYQVDASFTANGNALIEAPTGVGKSLGYGVPAAHAASEGKRTVIVTANIALQEQLVEKDLPLLKKLLPYDFTFALAKGVGNYLCLDAYHHTIEDTQASGFSNSNEAAQWSDIVKWADTTLTGDVSELPFEPRHIRRSFTTTSDDCLGQECPHHGDCHVMAAKRKYFGADIVVTNYHLFFADLRIKSKGGDGVLPAYDYVVFDEGHKAADIARDFLGFKLTSRAVRWAARYLTGGGKKGGMPDIDSDLRESIEKLADEFFGDLLRYSNSADYQTRFRRENFVDATQLCLALGRAEMVYLGAAADPSLELEADMKEKLRKVSARCETIRGQIKAAVSLEAGDSRVYFLEKNGAIPVLVMKPIDVSEPLRKHLFESANVDSVIVTSATLTTGGLDGFQYVAKELGIDGAAELVAKSPFDFGANVQLVIPAGLQPPGHPGFPDCVADIALEAALKSGGRMLALFTSYKVLARVYERLRASNLPFRVMRQGDAPRTQLIKAFKADETSVLLGVDSFWAGIDVPGPALSVLLIDKLPFANPKDPLCDAASERLGREAFSQYSMPRALIQVRQGFGRLIRTTGDKGVVVICDRRIVDKPYGGEFFRALPAVPWGSSLEVIGGKPIATVRA